MSMPALRLSRVAVAAVALAGLGLAGCANYETLEPYQPAAGVQTDAPGVKVRNLMVISEGSTMHLAGSLIAAQDDSLSQVAGVALQENSDPGKPLTLGTKGQLKLPAGRTVNLADSNITVKGDVRPGGMAQVSLTFAQAQPLTLTVPVLDAEAAGFASASPAGQN
ncbi:hypothetical protein [Luteococcus peritonei]|uniref:Copper chaperone PCu(A)C n=1 Tax=Luteococcus peritonei TaxID=88874 RepID=A0ABW4RST7_9ACTN